MNAAKSSATWKDEAIRIIVRQGAWACLAFLVLSAVGYEIRWFIHTTGAAVTSYVQQSGENIKTLNSAVALLSANLDATSKQVDHCSVILENVQKTHEMQMGQTQQVIDAMENANVMMSPVPAKHDEEIKLLSEIRDKMTQREGGSSVPAASIP